MCQDKLNIILFNTTWVIYVIVQISLVILNLINDNDLQNKYLAYPIISAWMIHLLIKTHLSSPGEGEDKLLESSGVVGLITVVDDDNRYFALIILFIFSISVAFQLFYFANDRNKSQQDDRSELKQADKLGVQPDD